jgi:phosphohistidine phosphatase
MLRLWILRHAKSSWDSPELSDRERPLAPRGERAAAALGSFLAARPERIDLVLCSSARRAVDTVARLALDDEVPICEEDALYGAGADELLERVAAVEDDRRTVLLVGHNPDLEDLVHLLAGGGAGKARRRLARGLKTACLAELELEGTSWAGIQPGHAALSAFTRPKDLAGYAASDS